MTSGEHREIDFGGSLQVDELVAGQQHMAKCRPSVGGLGVRGQGSADPFEESRTAAKVRGGGRATKHVLAEPVNSFGVIGGLAGQDRPSQPAAGSFDQIAVEQEQGLRGDGGAGFRNPLAGIGSQRGFRKIHAAHASGAC